MGIFHKLSRKMMRVNRVRTIVTIIGIVLSMTMLTAVIEGAWSGINYLKEMEIYQTGAYTCIAHDLTEAEAKKLTSLDEVRASSLLREVGWARIQSKNEYKPYLRIASADSEITDLMAVHISKGRMPRNTSEILIPDHLAASGSVKLHVGDTLRLKTGQREADGRIPETNAELKTEENTAEVKSRETLVHASVHTYRVVGFYARPSRDLEDLSCPGYTALTVKDPGNGRVTALITVKHLQNIKAWMKQNPEFFQQASVHQDLLRLYGVFGNDSWRLMLYGLAAALILLIVFGSVSLIYNSFSISVSERTRKYGMLRSIGATRRQIRASVFYEALLSAGIGIPLGLVTGCAGIGITLYLLQDNFSGFISGRTGAAVPVKIHLVLSAGALLLAAAICLLTVLLSAMVPARRAVMLSPIEAIRQTRDIRLRPRDVKTGKLSGRNFSLRMAGKNYRRNRRRSRTTVFALFVSVVLFITASSFSAYLLRITEVQTVSGADVAVIYQPKSSVSAEQARWKKYRGITGVKEAAAEIGMNNVDRFYTDRNNLSEDYQKFNQDFSEESTFSGNLSFLDDDTFRKLLEENHLSVQEYMNVRAPKGLLVNQVFAAVDGKDRLLPLMKTDAFPVKVTAERVTEYKKDGSEVRKKTELTVGAAIGKKPWFEQNASAIYYPVSAMDSLLGKDGGKEMHEAGMSLLAFRSSDHGQTAEELKKLISDADEQGNVQDIAAEQESNRMLITVVNVFAYGFIILISLIAVTNVFHIMSTGIILRKREFAMLRSVGMSRKGLVRMLRAECAGYGIRALAWGLPVSVVCSYLIYRVVVTNHALTGITFFIPWHGILIAVLAVFAVVFITMRYAERKISRENLIDALKNETI
ncbi:hypothetical protein CXIVA_17140 [Clostridium sp. SY8519]|uniref:ABC transporter permease n=1 Tax=Clostridium sp. (strain SY8519) TaxID=1042156 RepID=UPI0002171CFE|nr:FtsX-like permease family protein [Clostridium sp. SY8519]BAK47680.1 hypothetical protein CXIVA_17140 [Clostridium sp. SY8519]